ncbi:SLC13 family permease [Desulfuromonas sp. AOP6]|uniref:SLC13 family permease n=1 Tax=Desulfuromonas sp. AOP6 TaxID=1566351 RepID=UPI001274B444|nr:SLC13 family permease [Desulfuromonas sp. AOP6]BCA81157.1 SLC13 family permease [Desulfuromonas sp. AOP6]
MTQDQILIIAILLVTIVLFLWGRWRHDIVAGGALLACVIAGLVPAGEAFLGFGHPAVITVACVLVLSQGLQMTGAVDALAQKVLPSSAGPIMTITALTALGAVLSAFMNNVGALALLMPVAFQLADKKGLSPGRVLMPLSFGTILGGMTTLIGTPPNLIVASFRQTNGVNGFSMFDYTPVGLTVAVTGIIFIVLLGWRLVPIRKQEGISGFETGAYFTEVRIGEDSKVVDRPLRDLEHQLEEADAQIVGMVRHKMRVIAPNPRRLLHAGDILVIEADPEALAGLLSSLNLELEEAIASKKEDEEDGDQSNEAPLTAQVQAAATPTTGDKTEKEQQRHESEETVIQELVVMPNARLISRTATDLQLRTRYGLNLLALSRQGRRSIKRLRVTRILAGDLLLMQGSPEALSAFASEFSCVPLAARAIRIPDRRKALVATLTMLAAVGGAAFGLLPAAIAFAAGVLVMMTQRIIPLQKLYEAIDWPVIVLLAALIPVAGAMASTGTADLLAQGLLQNLAQGRPVLALALILITTMTLSDFMNNAATAAVMCPLSISTATQLNASPDAFLMAVAVGASCAFLTPIGHQNNTLILGPGGFRFGDYWRLGLPMEILVVAVSIPMLLWVWPL